MSAVAFDALIICGAVFFVTGWLCIIGFLLMVASDLLGSRK